MALARAGVRSQAKEFPGKFLRDKYAVLLIVEESIDLVVWHAVGKANICYQSEKSQEMEGHSKEVDSGVTDT